MVNPSNDSACRAESSFWKTTKAYPLKRPFFRSVAHVTPMICSVNWGQDEGITNGALEFRWWKRYIARIPLVVQTVDSMGMQGRKQPELNCKHSFLELNRGGGIA